jgi:quercetin dioxygenase-like cupin family protein
VAAMADVFALSDMQSSPTAWKFEGGPRAEAPVSFFLTHTPPGKGPGLHVHPYPEVFLVQEGTATFRVGGEEVQGPRGTSSSFRPRRRTASRTTARARCTR